MLAFSTDTAKQFGLYGIIGVLVIGLLAAIVVRKVVGKIISLVITVGLAAVLLGQRGAIDDCVKKVQTEIKTPTANVLDTSCKFFGKDIKIPADKLPTTTVKK